MSVLIPNGRGGFEKTPNILVKRAESRMRGVRDLLKRKLGDLKYQAHIAPLKAVIRQQMQKDDTGPVETSNYFIAAFARKNKLSPTKHASLIAAAYELLEEKA